MQTRAIPRSGETIPVIGMGTSKTFDVGSGASERTRLVETLRTFYGAGGRLIDSSPMYGRAEDVVGDVNAEIPGAKPFLATKVWTTGRAEGIRQMEESARRFRTRVIDLMQIHNLVDWKTHLDTLRGWKKEGRIRYLGVTDYKHSAFPELERIITKEQVDFVQLPYSIGVREAEKRLLPAARDHQVAVLVMEPFESGDLFRKVKGKALPDWTKAVEIGSWAQFFLKWILGHPAVTCPIPATGKPAHMADNVRAGFGPMPDEALRRRMVAFLGL